MLKDKRVLVTGGTGSLGNALVRRLLSEEAKITVFSRDETKQHFMKSTFPQIRFKIGDVRDFHSVVSALRDIDIVVNAAAMKQVPTCEYFPYEAVLTNIVGAENIVRAVEEYMLPVETVVGISTDKACKPVNTMGMTKAIQERIFIQGNLRCRATRFVCVRYGNVLESRGSVIPLFRDQIRNGGPVTITTSDMTRFLLTLDEAADTVFTAIREGLRGEIYIPKAPAARVVDIANMLIGNQKIKTVTTGVRPGEKTHEILISEEECLRTVQRGNWYVIQPMLDELKSKAKEPPYVGEEFSSAHNLMSLEKLGELLAL